MKKGRKERQKDLGEKVVKKKILFSSETKSRETGMKERKSKKKGREREKEKVEKS